MELWEGESYFTECAGVFLKTLDFKYSTRWRRRRIWEVFLKRKAKIKAREAWEILTRAANAKRACSNLLMRKSPHIKCDGRRISGHEKKIDLPKKTFPYSYALPNKGWQRNKRGSWRIAINGRPYLQTSMLMTSKSMDERKCINFRQHSMTKW